jgi:hypothetical protein
MVKGKMDPIIVIVDSIIGYFIFLVFLGSLFQVITDPLISQNIGKISLASIFFVVAWWVYVLFFKKRTSLF